MCPEYEIISNQDGNFIARCHKSGAFNVAFGNLFLTQHESELRSFHRLTARYLCRWSARQKCPIRMIRIDTPVPNLHIVFSYAELLKLHDLLTRTLLILNATTIAN